MKYYLNQLSKFACLIVLMISCLQTTIAQDIDTTFHKKDGEEITAKDPAYFKRIIRSVSDQNKKYYVVEEYYINSNTIKLKGTSKDAGFPFRFQGQKSQFSFQGQKSQFYENGVLRSLENFSETSELIDSAYYWYPSGKPELTVFYPSSLNKRGDRIAEDPIYVAYFDSLENKTLSDGNGLIRLREGGDDDVEEGRMVNNLRDGEWKGRADNETFVETYKKGKLLKGSKIKENGELINYDAKTYFVQPEYPGGIYKLLTFIAKNYEYPKEAVKNGVNGLVEIDFVVDRDGHIEDIKVKSDLGFNTGEAGIRVVKMLKKWKPGIRRGEPVRVGYTLPIRLNLAR
ncbi:energy transducer TonB [Sphingobacterium multivorum]|uniref:energy transducer TonB n=1 Tax=Sphingobacterium multivorum TaxID=28454 RepID=UPI0028B02874|nr:energy transducer TonB [Sphingobacterium multivorum]